MILVINPGSTSSKISLFSNDAKLIVDSSLNHATEDINKCENVVDQKDFRIEAIEHFFSENKIDTDEIDVVIGRGGLMKFIEGGTYAVNDRLLEDVSIGVNGQHASNLGAVIANELANKFGVEAFIVDPPVVDELMDIARVSGIKGYERKSLFHALNQKAILRRYAKEKGLDINNSNVIVAHMGGGISVGFHKNGKVVDVNNGLGGQGPFSPERSGTLSPYTVIELMKDYDLPEVKKLITGKGGLVSLIGSNDMRDLIKLVDEGNTEAKLYLEAMAYQVAKEIASLSVVGNGKLDGIVLTGGVAYAKDLVELIKQRVEFLSEVTVYPGEDEQLALALAGMRVLDKIEEVKEYK